MSTSPPACSSNEIFYPIPSKLLIDENGKTKFANSPKIATLIEELKEKGPLIGLGKIGPGTYTNSPYKFEKQLYGHDIHSWKKDSPRNEYAKNNYVIVLGASKVNEQERVFYTLAKDTTPYSDRYIRQYQHQDGKVYVTSLKTFHNYLCDLYPPVDQEKSDYLAKLSSIRPLSSILNVDNVLETCKALGQEIFDKYKAKGGGNSFSGEDAVKDICMALMIYSADGALRKQYVERAWDGIGDHEWRWLA